MKKKIIALIVGLGLVLAGIYYLNGTKANVDKHSEISQSQEKDIENENADSQGEMKKVPPNLEDNSETTMKEEDSKDTVIAPKVENNTEVKEADIKKADNTNDETKKHEIHNNNVNVVDSKQETTTVEVQEEPKVEPVPEPVEIKPTPEEIEATIVKKYNASFTELKNEYEIKINNLIEQGKTEYFSLSEEERGKQKLKLGLKYLKLGRQLESECDEKFYALLDEMKKELKENDLKMDSADEAEKQYKEEKSSRRKQLLEKAMAND